MFSARAISRSSPPPAKAVWVGRLLLQYTLASRLRGAGMFAFRVSAFLIPFKPLFWRGASFSLLRAPSLLLAFIYFLSLGACRSENLWHAIMSNAVTVCVLLHYIPTLPIELPGSS